MKRTSVYPWVMLLFLWWVRYFFIRILSKNRFKEHKGKLLSLSVIAQAEPGVSVISSKPQKWHEMCRQKHESGTKCATFFIRHLRPYTTWKWNSVALLVVLLSWCTDSLFRIRWCRFRERVPSDCSRHIVLGEGICSLLFCREYFVLAYPNEQKGRRSWVVLVCHSAWSFVVAACCFRPFTRYRR